MFKAMHHTGPTAMRVRRRRGGSQRDTALRSYRRTRTRGCVKRTCRGRRSGHVAVPDRRLGVRPVPFGTETRRHADRAADPSQQEHNEQAYRKVAVCVRPSLQCNCCPLAAHSPYDLHEDERRVRRVRSAEIQHWENATAGYVSVGWTDVRKARTPDARPQSSTGYQTGSRDPE
jgi:hypothetical protein